MKKATAPEELKYRESAPDADNRVTITITDKNEKSDVVVERFSEEEMELLQDVVSRLQEKNTHNYRFRRSKVPVSD